MGRAVFNSAKKVLPGTLLALFCALFVAAAAIRFLPYPYPLLALAVLGALAVLRRRVSGKGIRNILASLMTVIAVLGIEESYLVGRELFLNSRVHVTMSPGLTYDVSMMGYRLKPDEVYRESKTVAERVLWENAAYTTDRFGLRNPNPTKNTQEKTLVFLGGSYLFGSGLSDEKTLPTQFERQTGHKYKTYNFGLPGYGSWQMYKFMTSGFVEEVLENRTPDVVVYSAMSGHIARDYLQSKLDLPFLWKYTLLTLGKSRLFKELYNGAFRPWHIKIYADRVAAMRDFAENKYKSRFLVLFWDDRGRLANVGSEGVKDVVKALRKRDVEVHVVEDEVFSKYSDSPSSYHIGGIDHPTEIANKRIAEFLTDLLS